MWGPDRWRGSGPFCACVNSWRLGWLTLMLVAKLIVTPVCFLAGVRLLLSPIRWGKPDPGLRPAGMTVLFTGRLSHQACTPPESGAKVGLPFRFYIGLLVRLKDCAVGPVATWPTTSPAAPHLPVP